jgi:hypothetical protein
VMFNGDYLWMATAVSGNDDNYDDDSIEITVFDPGGDVVAALRLEDPFGASIVQLFSVPFPDKVGLYVAGGQDGQFSVLVEFDGTEQHVHPLQDRDGTPPQFSPHNDWYISLDHGLLIKAEWPSMEEVVQAAELYPYDDKRTKGFNHWRQCFAVLSDRHIAWLTVDSRIFIVDVDAVRLAHEVIIEGHPLRPIAEVYPGITNDSRYITDVYDFTLGQDGTMVTTYRDGSLELFRAEDWIGHHGD